MQVRFILPSEDRDGEPLFDRTLDLPAAPLPGESVGIDPEPGSLGAEAGRALLVEVGHRRWFVNGAEPVIECWLEDSEGARRRNVYVHSGCRYGFEQMMNSRLSGSAP